jgi:hypothetical protein
MDAIDRKEWLSNPSFRPLTSHKVTGLNESLIVAALDGPGPGGASHVYVIDEGGDAEDFPTCSICFQNGPIQESGINGVSIEAILAVAEDRLIGFQSGQYACRENAVALTKLQECMMWLQKRTRDRVARGVEGTNKV